MLSMVPLVLLACSASPQPEPSTPSSSTTAAETSEIPSPAPETSEIPSPAPETSSEPPPVRSEPRPVVVAWSGIQRNPGCFYFSGPGALGRDDQLGEQARWSETDEGEVLLDFGERIQFRGVRVGPRVFLSRRSAHDFGNKWRIDEQLEGEIIGDTFEARYAYQECDTSGTEGCPGRCIIEARVTVTIPR